LPNIATSVADPEPGSGAFLPLNLGPDAIFPDLGYPTHSPESFVTIIFWVIQILQFFVNWLKFFSVFLLFFIVFGSAIQYPGGKKNQDPG
jgi:hypothetical protein